MGKFAVIDTETNWADQVMSTGTVIADAAFEPIEIKYHIPLSKAASAHSSI